jgi:hypothetical protein
MNAKQAKYARIGSDQFVRSHLLPQAAALFAASRKRWYLRLLGIILPGLRRRFDAIAMNKLCDRLYGRVCNIERYAKLYQLTKNHYTKAVDPAATRAETRHSQPRTAKEPRT